MVPLCISVSYAEFLALFHKNETTLGKEMKVLVDRGTSATKREHGQDQQ